MYIATETISKDKTKNTVKKVAGIVIAVFFGMAVCGAFMNFEQGDVPAIIFSAILAACGVWMAVSGVKGNQLVSLATRCSAVIGSSHSYNISQLATELNIPKAKLRTKLEKMFARRYFPSGRFDNTGEQISFGQLGANGHAGIYGGQTVTAICASCGGVNQVPRKKGCVCEYCGSPLSVK